MGSDSILVKILYYCSNIVIQQWVWLKVPVPHTSITLVNLSKYLSLYLATVIHNKTCCTLSEEQVQYGKLLDAKHDDLIAWWP